MNFSKFDMVLLVVMSIGIVVMSFVFPALGLTSVETGESDIPEFSMQGDRFDFSGEFPDMPGTPSEGTLEFHTTENPEFYDTNVWLEGGQSSGTQLLLNSDPNPDNDTARTELRQWDGGSLNGSETHLFGNGTGERVSLEVGEYRVVVELVTAEDRDGGTYYQAEWEVMEQPASDGGWLDRIPIVGGIVDAGETLASVVAWGVSVVWWFVTSSWELALNLLGMLFDVVTFLFASASWLATTYGGIIEAADAWVSVFVAIPGLLLSLEFAKLGMIGISLLPFT